MLLHSPSGIYAQVAEQLDTKWNQSSRDALAYLEGKLTDKGPMMYVLSPYSKISSIEILSVCSR